jgi:hypothetical protein
VLSVYGAINLPGHRTYGDDLWKMEAMSWLESG